MTELQRQIDLTQRILGGGVHSILVGEKGHRRSGNPNRDVTISSSGVRTGAACGASAREILDGRLATPESKLSALLEGIPADIARVIRLGKESIAEKISAIRMKFFRE